MCEAAATRTGWEVTMTTEAVSEVSLTEGIQKPKCAPSTAPRPRRRTASRRGTRSARGPSRARSAPRTRRAMNARRQNAMAPAGAPVANTRGAEGEIARADTPRPRNGRLRGGADGRVATREGPPGVPSTLRRWRQGGPGDPILARGKPAVEEPVGRVDPEPGHQPEAEPHPGYEGQREHEDKGHGDRADGHDGEEGDAEGAHRVGVGPCGPSASASAEGELPRAASPQVGVSMPTRTKATLM